MPAPIGHAQGMIMFIMRFSRLAFLFLVAFGVRRGYGWAWVGAVASPVLALAVALPAHYPNNFDTLGHLGLIYLATLIFVVGALLAGKAIWSARTT